MLFNAMPDIQEKINNEFWEYPEIQEVVERHNLCVEIDKFLMAGHKNINQIVTKVSNLKNKLFQSMQIENSTYISASYAGMASHVVGCFKHGYHYHIALSNGKTVVRLYRITGDFKVGVAKTINDQFNDMTQDIREKTKLLEEKKKIARLQKIENEAKALRAELGV